MRLQSSVLHPVLVYAEIVEDFGDAGGGARQQAFLLLSHQPLAGVGGHVAGDVLFGPAVQPGVEAPVQASVNPLVGLKERETLSKRGTQTLTSEQNAAKEI